MIEINNRKAKFDYEGNAVYLCFNFIDPEFASDNVSAGVSITVDNSATFKISALKSFSPKRISIISPVFTSAEALAGLSLIITLPASQASFAIVRRLIRRDTFKNLSSRISIS